MSAEDAIFNSLLLIHEPFADTRAILAALRAAGYAVVPREPTPEFVAAWWQAKNTGGSDYDAYRAMLAAAEKEPGQ